MQRENAGERARFADEGLPCEWGSEGKMSESKKSKDLLGFSGSWVSAALQLTRSVVTRVSVG